MLMLLKGSPFRSSSRILPEDRAPKPSTDKEKEKKKKSIVVKVAHKALLGEPRSYSGDDQEVDPLDNPEVIWALTDKFALLEVVDCLADLDRT